MRIRLHPVFFLLLFQTALAKTALAGVVLDAPAPPVDTPIAWRDLSPMAINFGLPRALDARLLPADQWHLDVHLEIANNFTGKEVPEERIFLDGESQVATLLMRRGMPWGEIGAELPWVRHTPGFLDRAIDAYHDATGLPDRGRRELPRGGFAHEWSRRGVTLLDLQPGSDIGDLRVFAAMPANLPALGDSTIRLQLKTPTGSAANATGSGAFDLAGSISQHRMLAVLGRTVSQHRSVGLLAMGDGDFAAARQKRRALFASFGLASYLGAGWTLAAQADAHTGVMESKLRAPGNWSIQGGLALRLRSRWGHFEFGFYEDLRPGSSVDFTVMTRWRVRLR